MTSDKNMARRVAAHFQRAARRVPSSNDVIKVLARAGYRAELGDGEDYEQQEHGKQRLGFEVRGWDEEQDSADAMASVLTRAGFDAESGDADAGDWPVYVVCQV